MLSGPVSKVIAMWSQVHHGMPPGDCSPMELCKKKVKISCACKRKKEEFKCNQSYGKDNLVACDDACKEASKQIKNENLKVVNQKADEESLRNQREAELFERQMEGGGKKRRRNRRTECVESEPSFMVKHKALLLGAVLVGSLSALLYVIIS